MTSRWRYRQCRMIASAVVLQCSWRQHAALSKLISARRSMAASILQRTLRTVAFRMSVKVSIQNRYTNSCAKRMQSCWFHFKAKKRSKRLRFQNILGRLLKNSVKRKVLWALHTFLAMSKFERAASIIIQTRIRLYLRLRRFTNWIATERSCMRRLEEMLILSQKIRYQSATRTIVRAWHRHRYLIVNKLMLETATFLSHVFLFLQKTALAKSSERRKPRS